MTLDYESVQPIVLDFSTENSIDLYVSIPEYIGVTTNIVYLVNNSLGTKLLLSQLSLDEYKVILIPRLLETSTYHIECQAEYGSYISDNFDITVYKPDPPTPTPSPQNEGYFYYGVSPNSVAKVWVDPRDL